MLVLIFCYDFYTYSIAKKHYLNNADNEDDVTKNSTWTLDGGYTNSSEKHPMHYSGRYEAIEVFRLKISRKTEKFTRKCHGAYRGFRVYLHSPDEVTTKHYFRVTLGTEVIVKVLPKMSIISDSLRNFDADHRQCYLPGERNLKYFKHYSQNNCRIECVSNFTFKECGCVKFNMIKNSTMRICQQKDIKCYKQVDKIYTSSDKFNRTVEAKRDCNCWPACTTLEYEFDTFTAEYDDSELDEETTSQTEEETNAVEKAFLKINFKDTSFLKLKRIEIYDSLDFLANCGGLLGELSLNQHYHDMIL